MEKETGYDWVPRKAAGSNAGLESSFVKVYICVDCGKELTWNEKVDSHGCCPHCGHTVPGTIVETRALPLLEQIKKKGNDIPWRNETPEQKAFGYGMIAGFLACMLGALVGMWTHG